MIIHPYRLNNRGTLFRRMGNHIEWPITRSSANANSTTIAIGENDIYWDQRQTAYRTLTDLQYPTGMFPRLIYKSGNFYPPTPIKYPIINESDTAIDRTAINDNLPQPGYTAAPMSGFSHKKDDVFVHSLNRWSINVVGGDDRWGSNFYIPFAHSQFFRASAPVPSNENQLRQYVDIPVPKDFYLTGIWIEKRNTLSTWFTPAVAVDASLGYPTTTNKNCRILIMSFKNQTCGNGNLHVVIAGIVSTGVVPRYVTIPFTAQVYADRSSNGSLALNGGVVLGAFQEFLTESAWTSSYGFFSSTQTEDVWNNEGFNRVLISTSITMGNGTAEATVPANFYTTTNIKVCVIDV